MKKIVLLFLILAFLSACAVSEQTKMERAAKKELLAKQVREGIEKQHFSVDVRIAHPLRGRPIHLSSPYDLEVKGDTIVSYLPYFGRAYSVPYGGGKGLNFLGRIMRYEVNAGRKGEYLVKMDVDNEEDHLLYLVTVFENGSANVDVSSKNRDRITFTGDFNPEKE